MATIAPNPYLRRLDEMVEEARQAYPSWDKGDSGETNPLDDLADALRTALAVVDTLKNHAHRYDENSYCTVCGQDGRS